VHCAQGSDGDLRPNAPIVISFIEVFIFPGADMSALISQEFKSPASAAVAVEGPFAPVVSGHATIHAAPHHQMVRSKLNVRRKVTDVTELAALIRSQGLLQNLVGFFQVVEGTATGVVEVVAGGRRLEAIGVLIEQGDLPADFQVPYLCVTEDEAVAISLAENLGRENMHPADVFEAMLALSARGRSIEDIALGFNVDILTVRRRLKLANVSPRLLTLYRNDEASFEQMMALAITDDHSAQEQAWDGGGKHGRSAHELRRLLTAQQINVQTDRVARFVGVGAFEKAGGVITCDLFSNSGTGYIADAGLLERLAMERLEKQGRKLSKEGNAWVDILPRADHAALSEYARVRTIPVALTPDQVAQLDTLDVQISALESQIEARGNEGGDQVGALETQLRQCESQRRTLAKSPSSMPHPDDKLLAGAVVTLDEGGNVVVKRDLIRPADKTKIVKLIAAAGGADAGTRSRTVHSDRLTRILTSHRTIALQAQMMDRPDVALVVLTHTLLLQLLRRPGMHGSARVTLSEPSLADEVQQCAATLAVAARREQIISRIPDGVKGDALLEWLHEQPQSFVQEVLAFCVARSIDTVQLREGPSSEFSPLAKALKLDMSAWWAPTAASYFDHVSKERTLAVVTHAVSAQAAVPLENMKKGVAAAAAERALAGGAWLPEPLRYE
jgi:ParB family chromosome partitioning protein